MLVYNDVFIIYDEYIIMKYDVVIVGAGPSGSSCAYNILSREPNLKVLLLDKCKFPRHKVCGGGIFPEVQNYLDFNLRENIDFICNNHEIKFKKRTLISNRELWLVFRDQFDIC